MAPELDAALRKMAEKMEKLEDKLEKEASSCPIDAKVQLVAGSEEGAHAAHSQGESLVREPRRGCLMTSCGGRNRA